MSSLGSTTTEDWSSQATSEVKNKSFDPNIQSNGVETEFLYPQLLPVEVRRTNSYPSMPGSDEMGNADRALGGNTVSYKLPEQSVSSEKDWNFDVPLNSVFEKPTYSRSKFPTSGCVSNKSNSDPIKRPKQQFRLSECVELPPKPIHLMDGHFEVTGILFEIARKIDATVRNQNDTFTFDYIFEPSTCTWKGCCIDMLGCGKCEVEIQIFRPSGCRKYEEKNTYIVEANRLEGDFDIFTSFYFAFKSSFHPPAEKDDINSTSYLDVFGPTTALRTETVIHTLSEGEHGDSLLNSESNLETERSDAHKSTGTDNTGAGQPKPVRIDFEPILQMACSPLLQARIEASKMLYQIARNDHFDKYWCTERSVAVLSELSGEGSPDAARHCAIMTIAVIASKTSWQEHIINAGVIPLLLRAVTNGSYALAELRREAARTLQYLSSQTNSSVAYRIPDIVADVDANWFDTIDSLSDDRVKLHAMCARAEIQKIMEQKARKDSISLLCVT